jgi:hypothetical protein
LAWYYFNTHTLHTSHVCANGFIVLYIIGHSSLWALITQMALPAGSVKLDGPLENLQRWPVEMVPLDSYDRSLHNYITIYVCYI